MFDKSFSESLGSAVTQNQSINKWAQERACMKSSTEKNSNLF